jgi:hypothetical protein
MNGMKKEMTLEAAARLGEKNRIEAILSMGPETNIENRFLLSEEELRKRSKKLRINEKNY